MNSIENRLPFTVFLFKNKDDKSYEVFYNHFIRTLKLHGYSYKEDSLKELILNLYNMDNDYYLAWYNTFSKINYNFVRRNNSFINDISKYSNNNLILEIAIEMEKYSNSLISKSMPISVNVNMVKKDKYLLTEILNDFIDEVSIEDNDISWEVKKAFINKYGKYKNDPLLEKFYSNILRNININILNEAIDNLKKIKEIEENLNNYTLNSMINEDNYKSQKRKRVSKSYRVPNFI